MSRPTEQSTHAADFEMSPRGREVLDILNAVFDALPSSTDAETDASDRYSTDAD